MSLEALAQEFSDHQAKLQAIRSKLVAERKSYEAKIKAVDALIERISPQPKAPTPVAPQSESRGRGRPPSSGVSLAVVNYVTAHPWLTVRELVAALPNLKAKSVDSTVRAMVTAGRLIQDFGTPRRFAMKGTPLPGSNGANSAA